MWSLSDQSGHEARARLAPPETEMENFKVKTWHDYHGDPMVFIVVNDAGNECARFGCWPEPATRTIKTGH
jgi:hypothetical protein